jgi:hypothetical protein
MHCLKNEIKNHILNNLSEAWIEESYFWQDDFIDEYFTDYFISSIDCYSSINNEAGQLNYIIMYLQMYGYRYDSIVPAMNTYVKMYAMELCDCDNYIYHHIDKIIRIKKVKRIFPLIMNRYLPIDVLPTIHSFLSF